MSFTSEGSAGSPKLARTAEGLLALGSAAQMRLEITITRGIEPDLVERQQAAGQRVPGRLTDPHRPGALRCVRVGHDRQPPSAAPPRLSDRLRTPFYSRPHGLGLSRA